MKRIIKRILPLILAVISILLPSCGKANDPAGAAVGYLIKNTPTLTYGGEWTAVVLSLAGQGEELLAAYPEAVSEHVAQKGGELHASRYSEYSRVVYTLALLGTDPRNIGGYDLTEPLLDFDAVTKQGINGAAWAFMALDAANGDPDICTRYLDAILAAQNDDGSFGTLAGSEVDITAMCLRAIGAYIGSPNIKAACERGFEYLASRQGESGGFPSAYGEASESISQVLLALDACGYSYDDGRFAYSLADALLKYQNKDGGFAHSIGGASDRIATEQAAWALLAIGYGSADTYSCSFSIICPELVECDALNIDKRELVPEGGVIFATSALDFTEGESVFDILVRVCRENKIHLEYSETPVYATAYIEGIANLYEFDAGALSGWSYTVNGESVNYGSSKCYPTDGDVIVWEFSPDGLAAQ